jgi:hypothetical protein
LIAIIWIAATGADAQSLFPAKCPDGTPLPSFQDLKVSQPIDASCGLSGKPGAKPAIALQDTAKNNFCAAAPVRSLTIADLIDLQNNTPSLTGPPTSRTALRQKGEGSLVRLKASLIRAHHSDVTSGESVNCGIPGQASNDVHMALALTSTAQECSSVTAEISPHFRPTAWNAIGLFEEWDPATNKYVVHDQNRATQLRSVTYRVTGQLFYDASHAPCPCGKTNCGRDPQRSADWEIHPIYALDVCKPGTSCNVESDADWMPFDHWWKAQNPK